VKVLLLNQCFWPDVVSTAQQLTDLGTALAERGHEVTVIASDRGYDNPRLRFPRRELWRNINIVRLRAAAGGKRRRWQRAVNFGSFLVRCALKLATCPRQDVVVALTSPPLISWLAATFTRIKGGRLVFWVMDLNPDEAVAAGWLKENSWTARFLAALLRNSLRHSSKIVALDRFAAERIAAKGIPRDRIEIIPPWSLDDAVRYDPEGREAFRSKHGLANKYVVMYAGNHSPCHPLDTLTAAAERLQSRTDIAFCFVGGGSEQRKVSEFAAGHSLANVHCLPYQPLAELSASLSAADLQVVVMGEGFTGIVHPSKVYNILAIGSPFLYIGPPESHVVDIAARLGNESKVKLALHGDVDAVSEYIAAGADARGSVRPRQGAQLAQEFSKRALAPRLIDVLELWSAPAERSGDGALDKPGGRAGECSRG
jgi:colanic acid biosynthesis glycosyl transferase WcaI